MKKNTFRVNSGEVFYMDLKNLGFEKNLWVCLGETEKH